MIYNIAGKVFYANGDYNNAMYAFQKARSLGEDDLLYLGLSYLKLFQRYASKNYLEKAIESFKRIKKLTPRVKQILEVFEQIPEYGAFMKLYIKNQEINTNEDPLIGDLEKFLREHGKIYPKRSLIKYWESSKRYPLMDPVMLAQLVFYSLYQRKPMSEELLEEMVEKRFFPLGYNPNEVPHIIKRKLREIYKLDQEILTLSQLVRSTGLIEDRLHKKHQQLLKSVERVFPALLAFFPREKTSLLYNAIIKSLRSLTPEQKWKLLERVGYN